MSGLADLKIEARPPKEAILLTFRDRMAQPPLGLGRRLRLPEEVQGESIRRGQPARHHPLGISGLQGRAGCQALSLWPPSLPAPALSQLELAQRKLGLGRVSLVRLHPGNSFGLRGHGGCTASGTESTLRAESERKGEDKVS